MNIFKNIFFVCNLLIQPSLAKKNLVLTELSKPNVKKETKHKIDKEHLKTLLKKLNQTNKVNKVVRKNNNLYISVKLSKGPIINYSYKISQDGALSVLDSISIFH
jgi:hypothetical protein